MTADIKNKVSGVHIHSFCFLISLLVATSFKIKKSLCITLFIFVLLVALFRNRLILQTSTFAIMLWGNKSYFETSFLLITVA